MEGFVAKGILISPIYIYNKNAAAYWGVGGVCDLKLCDIYTTHLLLYIIRSYSLYANTTYTTFPIIKVIGTFKLLLLITLVIVSNKILLHKYNTSSYKCNINATPPIYTRFEYADRYY